MTETSATETEPPRQATPDRVGKIHPADILMHLIVTLLMPMFLAASDGNLYYAHMAALETVTAYRTRNHVDLVAVAQIVAFGLAALGSLSLSLADELSLPMILRLRGNANACSRSAEHNRRALKESQAARQALRQARTASAAAAPPYDPAYEAAVIAEVAQTQQLVADAQAQVAEARLAASAAPPPASSTPPPAAASPAPPAAASPAPPAVTQAAASVTIPASAAAALQGAPQGPVTPRTSTATPARAPAAAGPVSPERQAQAMWAAAMSHVAGEFTASIPHLPQAQRWVASRRAAVLSSCATDLLCGAVPPRPRPGDIGGIMRPHPG
jgi:hypothetical protein